MIKVMYGKKGIGKTKLLVDSANDLSRESTGLVVFLDDSDDLIRKLHYRIRFINVAEYSISTTDAFFGFICGIVSVNYDLQSVFIDGLTYITHDQMDHMEEFFDGLEKLSDKYHIDFTISANGDETAIPEFLKKYI